MVAIEEQSYIISSLLSILLFLLLLYTMYDLHLPEIRVYLKLLAVSTERKHIVYNVGKKALMSYANSEGPDQRAHPCKLIRAFTVRQLILQYPFICQQ